MLVNCSYCGENVALEISKPKLEIDEGEIVVDVVLKCLECEEVEKLGVWSDMFVAVEDE